MKMPVVSARLLSLGACFWLGGGLCPVGGQTSAERSLSLTNVAAIRAMAPEVANQHLPVGLEGVITYCNRSWPGSVFFQDPTDGIYVHLMGRDLAISVGDRVQLEGETDSGDYAPVIRLRRIKKLGREELPKPELVTAVELATGQFDSRLVEVRGIVRSAGPASTNDPASLPIQLRADGKDLLLMLRRHTLASTNLVDAEVVVRGVAAGIFSWQRQLLEATVLVESDEDIRVIRPPPLLESLPVQTVQSLFRYSPEGFPDHRVRLRGQLLGRQAGKWLAVRDATSGLFVDSTGGDDLQPGDEVEVFGFPETRAQTLWLVKPIVHKLSSGEPVTALVSSVTNSLRHPCELHCVEGTLTGPPRPGEGSWVLNLKQGDRAFEAWLPTTDATFPAGWREGARVAVTGITEPFFLPRHRPVMYPFPQGLRLHARTIADVRIVQAAPWWTSPGLTKMVLIGLAGALVLLGFTILVAASLARKNAALRETREQLRAARDELAKRYTVRTGEWQEELTARHAAEADFALLTAERTRLARELHDTLEQTLASTALQLDAARGFFSEQPAESERLLVNATEQLRESQLEVRRSVWNLRSIKLEEATLPEALQQLGGALADAHGPHVEVCCEGTPLYMPPGIASHLFRIAQEGVTNALKHAQAKRIKIVLRFGAAGVELQIHDDGCGFEPAQASTNGHFGLRGLHERARAVGGQLELDSKPGQGTRVRLTVPATSLRET